MDRAIERMNTRTSASVLYMSPQGLGCAFIGLHNMGGDSAAVRRLLSSLSRILLHSSAVTPLDGQAIGNILASLKSFSSDVPEVRDVLRSLRLSILRREDSLADMKSKELSMSFWGLQNMAADCEEVEGILDLLLSAISRPGSSFRSARPEEVLYAVGGLRRMSSRSSRVRQLVRFLAATAVHSLDRIEKSRANNVVLRSGVNEVVIGAALFGMQSMDDRAEEVLQLVAAMSRVINHSKVMLSDRAIANAAYGISYLSPSKFKELIDWWMMSRVARDVEHLATGSLPAQNSDKAL